MPTILFGERVEGANKYNWIPLYDGTQPNPQLSNDDLLDKRSVIFLPGGTTCTERGVNGKCRAMKKMLIEAGISDENMPHFYGVAYVGGSKTDQHRYQVLSEVKQSPFSSKYGLKLFPEEYPYYQPFFDMYILPLLVDAQGKPRSLEKIKENIQNITFVTHCHGGFMAWQIEKMMADKLNELYPKDMCTLMSNVRMIHFASRRPMGVNQWGKHLDIISLYDKRYGDLDYLEYDNIHKQVHRASFREESALIPVLPNDVILVVKRLTTVESGHVDDDYEHGEMVRLFSKEDKNIRPENMPAIQLTQQILRHFVECPADQKDLVAQLTQLDSSFTRQNIENGKKFFNPEKEAGQLRRGVLSLISDWGAHLGCCHEQKTENSQILREQDDEGRFLYMELKKRYQQTGDNLSLMSYIKETGAWTIPQKERWELALMAVQKQDWHLIQSLNPAASEQDWGFGRFLDTVPQKQFIKMMQLVRPEDLYYLMPVLSGIAFHLKDAPDCVALLIQKIKKVKNLAHKKKLTTFLVDRLWLKGRSQTLKVLLQQASLKGKKELKSLLVENRQKQARILLAIMRERDKTAPGLTIREMQEARVLHVPVSTYLQYKAKKIEDPKLTLSTFLFKFSLGKSKT